VELGAEVRTVPVLPARLLIVDRTHAVVPIDPGDAAKGVAILRGAGALAVVSALFDHVWEAATSWGTRAREVRAGCTGAGPAGAVVTDEERALLRLMLRGDTDEQAGRKLGVSTRTVRRIAAGVMDRLGARSRFQAGALAVAWGWLRPDHEPAPFG
jgi:DNA-binding CsgD family transcriptional regulator